MLMHHMMHTTQYKHQYEIDVIKKFIAYLDVMCACKNHLFFKVPDNAIQLLK